MIISFEEGDWVHLMQKAGIRELRSESESQLPDDAI